MRVLRDLSSLIAIAVITISNAVPAAADQKASAQAQGCQFEAAVTAFNQNNATLAGRLFQACQKADTELAASSFYLGILARNAKRLPEARALLTRATELNPTSVGYRLELAVTHEWMNSLNQAKQIYQSVLRDDAQNLPARVGIARMDQWQGNVEQSINAYQTLNQENPGNSGIRSGLAMALLADGKLDQSRALLEQNLAANPEDRGAKEGLEMIDKIRKHTIDFYASAVRQADGQRSRRIQLLTASQMNYRWRLLTELSSGRKNSTLGVNNANTGTIDSEAAVTAVYRFSTKTTATFGLKYQHLASSENQMQLQLAGAHSLTPDQTVSFGLIPTLTGGRLTSTLGYAGYSYSTQKKWVASGTVYGGWDRDATNSVAASLTIGKEWSSRSDFRIGVSASRTGTISASTVFGQFRHPLSDNVALNLRFNESLSGKEREVSLGLRIEF